jgi:circadian clock protein KaiC
MKNQKSTTARESCSVPKCPTGIRGLDEILAGGLPRGRICLVFGGPGCGKTMLGMEFIYNGITNFGEPGLFVTFEESREKLLRNMGGRGLNMKSFLKAGKLEIEEINAPPAPLPEAGEFTLDGLFVRLEAALKRTKAKRIVLDTMETLFSGFENERTLRAELKRLFVWLEERGLTGIVTGEQGGHNLTRHNLEEYIADCVISLDHRVKDHISTRRLRILKYRGCAHATDEFPFLINEVGITVFPITTLELKHKVSTEIISTGVPDLDKMFEHGGFHRGSTALISGTAGTGKTTLCASFLKATCSHGGKTLYFAFEESQDQFVRNMRSVGLNLEPYLKKGLARYEAVRPTVNGLEAHLFKMQQLIEEFQPEVVIVDPITNFLAVGTTGDVKMMLMRLIDHLKSRLITTIFTSLTEGGTPLEQTDIGVSSLIDTWILVRDIELNGERNRGLYVLKARGAAHSNQIREFLITSKGLRLMDVYVSPEGILIGSRRIAQQERDKQERLHWPNLRHGREKLLTSKLRALESEIALLRAAYEQEEFQLERQAGPQETKEARAAREAEMKHRTQVHLA